MKETMSTVGELIRFLFHFDPDTTIMDEYGEDLTASVNTTDDLTEIGFGSFTEEEVEEAEKSSGMEVLK